LEQTETFFSLITSDTTWAFCWTDQCVVWQHSLNYIEITKTFGEGRDEDEGLQSLSQCYHLSAMQSSAVIKTNFVGVISH
jgi:hypothetical protein